MNVQSASSTRSTSTPNPTGSDATKTAAPSADSVVDAVAEAAATAAVDLANDTFESAHDNAPGLNGPVGDTGAEFSADMPSFRINPATGRPLEVKLESAQQTQVTSADKKTQATLDTNAQATVSPNGIGNVQGQTKLSASHEGKNGSVDGDARVSTHGGAEANLHAEGATNDGKTSGQLDAHADNASAHVKGEGRHEGNNGTVDADFEVRSDKTFDVNIAAEGQSNDGRFSGDAEISADEKGAAVKAQGDFDGDKVDIHAEFAADSHDNSASAAIAVDSQHVDASAKVAHDQTGTSAQAKLSVDTKNVQLDAEGSLHNDNVQGRVGLDVVSNDGSVGVAAELEAEGSFSDPEQNRAAGSFEAFLEKDQMKFEVGLEGETGRPVVGTGRVSVQDKSKTVELGLGVKASERDVQVRADASLRF